MPKPISKGWQLPAVALIYALLGAAGLALALPPSYASPLFPASGFALSMVLWYGRPMLAAVALGSMGMEFALYGLGVGNLLLATGMAVGATLQVWLASTLVRRGLGARWHRLEYEKDVFLFLLLGGVLACAVSASFGVVGLYLSGIIPAAALPHTWWTWYVGDALGVLIFAPLTLLVLSRGDSLWKERRRHILVPMLITLALVTGSFLASSRWEEKELLRHVQDQGQSLESQLHDRIVANQTILISLARFIEVTPAMDAVRFEQFTRPLLLENPDLMALSFNALVGQDGRAAFEAGAPGVRITDQDGQSRQVPAPVRAEYVPITFIAPLEKNRIAIGFDINSEPARQMAIARGRASGQTTITAPIALIQDSRHGPSFLALHPVYGGLFGGAPHKLLGFAVSATRVDEMVALALRHHLHQGMEFLLVDPTAAPERRVLYRSDRGQAAPDLRYLWRTRVAIADREWELQVFPTQTHLEQHRSWVAWSVGVAGLLFAGLLQVLMLGMTGRTEMIRRKVDEQTAEIQAHRDGLESQVAERTAQLSASEANTRLILESTADGLFGLDMQGRITFINPAACRLLGLRADDVVGRQIPELSRLGLAAPENEGQGVAAGDERFHHADGHAFPVIFAAHPMRQEGHVVGAVVSFMDITDRKALELAREAALLEAERLARVKSEFLANMSHEIRTPLNGVLGMAQLGFRASAGRQTQRHFGRIVESGRLLLGIINDILDFSKIEAGKMNIEHVPFQPGRMLYRLGELLGEKARGQGLELRLDKAPDLPEFCLGDPLRTEQVLMNLLSNALKFTEQGHVVLWAGTHGERLVFRVSDTGIGMSLNQVTRIFSPFEQADGSTTRKFGGTGLGLTISRRLAELMHGHIRVESEVGVGSVFELSLPLEVSAAREAYTAAALPTADQTLAGLRVLAAEDNEINQLVLEDMLTGEGASVVMVGNGQEAVDCVRRDGPSAFDIVLMDIQMPVMDGLEATRLILQLAPGLPIVGQTAHAMAEEKARCFAVGMVDHLAKPLEIDELVAVVLKHTSAA